MQLIARHGFKNNAKELIVFAADHEPLDADGNPIEGRHPEGVHKGARFSIGGDKKPEEMKSMQKHLTLIRELNSACVIADANDKPTVDKIDAEVKTEKAQQKETARLIASGSQSDLARQLATVLAELGVLKKSVTKPEAAA